MHHADTPLTIRPSAPARGRGQRRRQAGRLSVAGLSMLVMLAALPRSAAAVPICTDASRTDRKASCILEGDTGIEKGLPWVLLDVDAPSIANPGCPAEKADGEKARDRLIALMEPGYTLIDSGRRDRNERARVTIRLADGRDAGNALIAEDLARPWQSKGNLWCGW